MTKIEVLHFVVKDPIGAPFRAVVSLDAGLALTRLQALRGWQNRYFACILALS